MNEDTLTQTLKCSNAHNCSQPCPRMTTLLAYNARPSKRRDLSSWLRDGRNRQWPGGDLLSLFIFYSQSARHAPPRLRFK